MISLSAIALTSLLVLAAAEAPKDPPETLKWRPLPTCWLLAGEATSDDKGECRVMTAEDAREIERRADVLDRCNDLGHGRSAEWLRKHRPECIDLIYMFPPSLYE